MIDAEPWDAGHQSNLSKADGATSANTHKTKKSNKIPQDAMIRGNTDKVTSPHEGHWPEQKWPEQKSPQMGYSRPETKSPQVGYSRSEAYSRAEQQRSPQMGYSRSEQQRSPQNAYSRVEQKPSRRNSAANGSSARRQRQNWNAMMPAFMARLGADMAVQLTECAQSEEDNERMARCMEDLKATLAELGPRWSLEVFGSIKSTFCTKYSDIDATCVWGPSEEEEDKEPQPEPQTVLIERLSPLFRDRPQFKVVEEIPSAKVPILRLCFEEKLDIDLSCQNTSAMRNSRLLRAYAQLNPRVKDLGLAVKLWAKAAGVCGASQSKLSSYTFTLLMVYFMQVHREIMLPCLSPGLFEDGASEETLAEKLEVAASSWTCQLSLPDLFFRFIGFYTMEFEWGREVAAPRLGQRRYARDGVFDKLRGRFVQRLHVEDPYVLERNLHCVLGEPEETQLQEAFHLAWQTLFHGLTPAGLGIPLEPSQLEAGQKVELELMNELNWQWSPGGTPQSTPTLGPAADPSFPAELWSSPANAEIPENKAMEGATTQTSATDPLGQFSSAGSTESGDASAPHDPCASISGESRRESDDEAVAAASGARPRVLSLEEIERQMNHKQAITAIAKTSPLAGAANPLLSGNGQWWHNLGAANIVEAVKVQEKKSTSVFTVQDLERKMTYDSIPEDSWAAYNAAISPLLGRSFGNRATSKIAAQISSKYFDQVAIACQ